MNKVLLFGANGQIGKAIALQTEVIGVTSSDIDYGNLAAVKSLINSVLPDVVINCAAYTAVDKAEDEMEESHRLNVTLPQNLMHACMFEGIPLIHFSTDYVFGGESTGSYSEYSSYCPLNVYGLHKAIAEVNLQRYNKARIFRVQGVYSEHRSNFYKAILSRIPSGYPLNVVSDQYTCPTSADWIATKTLQTINSDKYGLYNLAPHNECSFADFAETIVDGQIPINRITSNEYGSIAKRPNRVIFNTSKFRNDFDQSFEDWKTVYYNFKKRIN